MKRFATTFLLTCVLGLASASAGEKGLMHCFAFTTIDTATPAEWEAFVKATDAWPSKFSEIKHVWVGKLARPLAQYRVDAATGKKFAENPKQSGIEATRVMRSWGVCMHMESQDTLKKYVTQPYHKEWMAAYEKVRVAGTTTYDIIGQ